MAARTQKAVESQSKCKEKACPFPADGPDGLCGRHRDMFSEEKEEWQSAEGLFAEVQLRRNTGRHVKEGHHLDLANPEANAARFNKEISTDKGGLFSREVAAERDKYKRIFSNARAKNRYQRRVRLHLCTTCGNPLEPKETRLQCRSCRNRNKGRCLPLHQRRRELGVCPKCGKEPPAAGRRDCVDCNKKRAAWDMRQRRKEMGLGQSDRLYNSKEVARIIGVHKSTISYWLTRGWIVSPAWHGKRALYWTDKELKAIRKFKLRRYKENPRRTTRKTTRLPRKEVLARGRRRSNKRYLLRRSLGLCNKCVAKVEIAGRWLCNRCLAEQRDKRKSQRAFCSLCSKPPIKSGIICEACRQKARRVAKKLSAAQKLRTKEEVNEKRSDYPNERSGKDRPATLYPTGGQEAATRAN